MDLKQHIFTIHVSSLGPLSQYLLHKSYHTFQEMTNVHLITCRKFDNKFILSVCESELVLSHLIVKTDMLFSDRTQQEILILQFMQKH